MRSFVDVARAVYGRVDVLVNNAGVMPLSLVIYHAEPGSPAAEALALLGALAATRRQAAH